MHLYLHVPFCRMKCAYCSFYSEKLDSLRLSLYLETLLREISVFGKAAGSISVDTVYFGGGTPSLLPKESVLRIMDCLNASFRLAGDAEITFEVNPESADRLEYLRFLAEAGVNRLSIGFQALNDRDLSFLGRIHDTGQALRTFALAGEAGFGNVGLDLIWGLPGQSPQDWLDTLRRAADLRPEHLSCYELSVDEGTLLENNLETGLFMLPDEEVISDIYLKGSDYLESRGYKHYEVSNFAISGFESRHNSACWQGEDYLGFGAGAVSTWRGMRFSNPSDIEAYHRLFSPLSGSGSPPVEEFMDKLLSKAQPITGETALRERLMLSLRTARGLDLRAYRSFTGKDFKSLHRDLIDELISRGLAAISENHFRLTKRGFILGNDITARLMP